MSTTYQVQIPDEVQKFIPKNISLSHVTFEDILEAYQDAQTFQKLQESRKIQDLDIRLS